MASYGKGSFDGFTPYQGDSSRSSQGGERGADFGRLSRDIGDNIQKINQNVIQIQRLVNHIGTQQDSNDLRQRLHETTHYTNQLAKETKNYLKSMVQLPSPLSQSEQRQCKMQRERLTDEFSNALTNFQRIQRTAADKERDSVQRARAHSGLDKSPFDSQQDEEEFPSAGFSQTRQVMQMAQDVDLEIIQEREDALKKLESDICDVNDIFKELGMLVHEQGQTLDSIEANIDSTALSVEEGTKELSKARSYQSKSRRKKCCLLILLLVVLIVIGVIIYVSVQ